MTSSLLADYFTQDELAAELGVTKMTLWNWDVRGAGPPVTRIGQKVYYARATVRAWMQSREERRGKIGSKREATAQA
jgi:predicted DNA-binding transcriptional regulator AlpA